MSRATLPGDSSGEGGGGDHPHKHIQPTLPYCSMVLENGNECFINNKCSPVAAVVAIGDLQAEAATLLC